MKLLLIPILALSLISLILLSCTSRPEKIELVRQTHAKAALNSGDSVCGIPFFGCLYGVKTLETTSETHGDTLIVKMYLKNTCLNRANMVPDGRWYQLDNTVMKSIFIRNELSYMESSTAPHGHDSARLNWLLQQNQTSQ